MWKQETEILVPQSNLTMTMSMFYTTAVLQTRDTTENQKLLLLKHLQRLAF